MSNSRGTVSPLRGLEFENRDGKYDGTPKSINLERRGKGEQRAFFSRLYNSILRQP